MISQVSSQQLTFYRDNGYVVIPGMLAAAELDRWRGALAAAAHRHAAKSGYHNQQDDGYYREVFLQLVNLWTTSEAMRQLLLDPRLGKLSAELAGVSEVRLYHDHAMNQAAVEQSDQLAHRQFGVSVFLAPGECAVDSVG